METHLRILVVEDDDNHRLLVQRELKKSDLKCSIVMVDSGEEYKRQLKEFKPDVILCDFSLPQFGALEALRILEEEANPTPLIIVTGTLSDEMAVDCLKKGAADYIIKDKTARLPSAIKRALELVKSKTEKAEALKRLRDSETQLKVITDVLPASLTYINADLTFKFQNRISAEWFKTDIRGKTVAEVLGANAAEQIQAGLDKLRTEGQLSFETRLESIDPLQFYNISLVPDNAKGFVCLITNITDRKRYEDELKSAKEKADSASRAKTQFLANVSHEMRTPLNSIMGLSDLLLTNPTDETERTAHIERILRNSEHLRKIIDETLDLSKIEAGKMEVQLSRVSPIDLIALVKAILAPLAQKKDLDLRFNVEGKIPDLINTDAEKVKHVLLNLIGNAIKFCPSGAVTMTVKSLSAVRTSGLEFLIQDTGIGIPPADRSRLFEPFMQVDSSSTRKFGGTGLGLVLARKYAKSLGGDVRLVSSEIGKGSTFAFTMECGAEGAAIVAPVPASLNATSENGSSRLPRLMRRHPKVLLVEDSEDTQYLVRRFLESEAIDLDVAVDGQQGVNMALSGHHDLILMDIQMPVLDGHRATCQLREAGYTKPIVAFTAHAFEEEKVQCLKEGFSDFLTKPVRKPELMALIDRYEPAQITRKAA